MAAYVRQHGHMARGVAAWARGVAAWHVNGGGAGHLLEGRWQQFALRRERGDGVGLQLVGDGLGGLLGEGGSGLLG